MSERYRRHEPVMVEEVLDALKPEQGGQFIDATLGDGGHAEKFLERIGKNGRLLGIERDPDMAIRAQRNLSPFGSRAAVVQGNFANLSDIALRSGFSGCDGILFDLGVSSYHFDSFQRGFSFRSAAPLDMRFNPQERQENAADIVNFAPPERLERILKEYGEERDAKRITSAILRHRPITTASMLAELIAKTKRYRRSLRHPATQTFQALRVAVNSELDALSAVLPQAVAILRIGGVLGVIAYHSLEDRIVKRFFQEQERSGSLEMLFHKPQHATNAEIRRNPRARSAKFRAARRGSSLAI